MAIWASRAYLRWYKAFNTETTEPLDASKRPWNEWNQQDFRFVEVPISPRICTIVGGNETGKSQLLGALQKVRNGKTRSGQEYSVRDICRYSGLLSVTEDIWPGLGIEFSFDTAAEFERVTAGLGAKATNTQKLKLKVFINGAGSPYVRFFDCAGEPAGTIQTKEDWEARRKHLPSVTLVRSDLELQNQVHITQLIAQYDQQEATAYEPVSLHELGDQLVAFDVDQAVAEAEEQAAAPAKDIETPSCDQLQSLQKQLKRSAFKSDAGLEYILFRKILGVEKPILERIRNLKSDHHGYVEQLKDDINHRLTETLDISEFWQQDEDFQLMIEYKAGFFYFLITDRTGAKYTFEERSGGLQFFLSYYIQLKAIRDSMKGNGAIVLMDEPDGFLSAAGQRNLLSVFELIARPSGRTGEVTQRCQVIYSTHSPFLVNKNYPDRIALVRKGDGGEGTQLVELVATRQYEPIRTGLGIESAETLFMGSENVVVEEVSAHRLLVAAIQRFGEPNRIDDMLDLNKVTIVSASGAWDIVRLLRATKRSKEKAPVTVVFLDGDKTGEQVHDELTGEGLVAEKQVTKISDAALSTTWSKDPQTLEDLVPPILLCEAAVVLAKTRWDREQVTATTLREDWENSTAPSDTRLVDSIVKAGGPLAKQLEPVQLRAAAFAALAELLSEQESVLAKHEKELKEFETVMRECCSCIATMLELARTNSRQDRLLKSVRLEIERYTKLFGKKASKADVLRCLDRLDVLPVGAADAALRTRENLLRLRETLNSETAYAGLEVDAKEWVSRLETFKACPWN
jgi:predicted ATP-dependent endonuclease of OLD family